ncbi:MAG TPA: PfkB family carbohydrate kinase [Stellaceae bacterium]|nr:PfkB family carbohydrate kinase [Stellaceae bacterium]
MIVVFGSINIDLIVPVPHLPIPGETVLGGNYLLAPGGKGANQAVAAARAGAAVTMIGAVGQDMFAEPALATLRRCGVHVGLVASIAQPTGCAIITTDAAGENQIAVASCANLHVRSGQVPDRLLDLKTVLVLQREVPDGENAAVIRRTVQRGGRIVLSLAPAGPIAPARLDDIDFMIANEVEATTLGDPATMARELRQGLVITRGAAGAVALLRGGETVTVPALPIQPVDTTGAGDAFAGTFAAGLDRGLPLPEALRRASAAASLTCLAVGAQSAMPSRADIETAAGRLPG